MKTKHIALAILLILLMFSCKTRERIVIKTVEIPRIEIRVDSVTIHRTDSFVNRIKGDTVWFESYKTIFKDRIKLRTDTITKLIEVPVEVKVDRIIEKTKRDWIWFTGLFSLLAGFAIIAIKIKKLF